MQECTLSKRQFEKNGFTVIVRRVLDDDADLSYLQQDYVDCTPAEQMKYKAQDTKRLAAYNRGDWHMLGITVEIRKQTKTNWANGGLEVGRASVWGYESDSDESFLKSEEESIITEAFTEVDNLREALCSVVA